MIESLDISLMINICGGVLMAAVVISAVYVALKLILGIVKLAWKAINWGIE